MAAIDDLINQIEDAELRTRMRAEVDKLNKQKKFGLVFEDHLPECVPLYGVPVRKGSLVARKAGPMSAHFAVLKLGKEAATCIPKGGGDLEDIALNDLVVVAEFGEPIYPYLEQVDSVCNAPESDLWHTLIEADNYHALQLLEYLYAGQVDCIYIDPPYNTGAKDWKYNNDFVDSNDAYRHSKWLSMIQRRLKIAKKLLNPEDSMLIVTIDEKEYLHLGCLLEELFSSATITMVTDVINPRAGVARPGSFTRNQEYIYFVQIGESRVAMERCEENHNRNPIWFSLMRTGSNSSRASRPNLFYPVYVNPNGSLHSVGSSIPEDMDTQDVQAPEEGLIAVWPLRPDGRQNSWQLGREALVRAFSEGTAKISTSGKKTTINYLRNAEKQRIAAGSIHVVGKDAHGALLLEYSDDFVQTKAPTSVWNRPSHDAGIYGSTLLNTIFLDKRFPYPKSLYAEMDAIALCVENKKDALVVDFFAGSGTTLHSLNLLNAQDAGARRCIMVTNNEVSSSEAKALAAAGYQAGDKKWEEKGIARHVTWPRTVCTIQGKDVMGQPLKGKYLVSDRLMEDGFKTNVIFFKLGFLDKTSIALGKQFREMLPTLWMKAGAHGPCPQVQGDEAPAMLVLSQNRFAVLTEEAEFVEFSRQVNNMPDIQTVYLVTDYEVGYRAMSGQLTAQQTFQLYRDYLDNFRINTARN